MRAIYGTYELREEKRIYVIMQSTYYVYVY